MKLHELKPTTGSRQKKHRIGRGTGSGWGETAKRGQNGQHKRENVRPGFEGGQMPLYKRLPKRGFKNVNRKEYAVINLTDLNKFEKEFNPEIAKSSKLIKDLKDGIKILGNGKIEKKLSIKTHKISKSAEKALKKFGCTIELIK